MNKINNFLVTYLKWTSPLALIAFFLSATKKLNSTLIYDLLGIVTIIWLTIFIYLVFALAFQNYLRNQFVRWIAGIKENDERESQIAGQASKKTFIFMTGLITLFIFLSVLRIDIYQNKSPNSEGKKNGEIRLGLSTQFILDKSEDQVPLKNMKERNYIIHYEGIPLATDGTLIIIGLLQILSFYYFSRKENGII